MAELCSLSCSEPERRSLKRGAALGSIDESSSVDNSRIIFVRLLEDDGIQSRIINKRNYIDLVLESRRREKKEEPTEKISWQIEQQF